VRYMIPFPDNQNCEGYKCSDCNWRYDIRVFGQDSEFWFASQSFETHDCARYKETETHLAA